MHLALEVSWRLVHCFVVDVLVVVEVDLEHVCVARQRHEKRALCVVWHAPEMLFLHPCSVAHHCDRVCGACVAHVGATKECMACGALTH